MSGFIATVLGKDEIKAKIEHRPVVKEYTDVFSEDISDREVEFTIDVLLGLHLYLRLHIRWPQQK